MQQQMATVGMHKSYSIYVVAVWANLDGSCLNEYSFYEYIYLMCYLCVILLCLMI